MTAAVVVAIGATWNLSQASEINTLSDLTLSNVDALASEASIPCICAWNLTDFCCTWDYGYKRVY